MKAAISYGGDFYVGEVVSASLKCSGRTIDFFQVEEIKWPTESFPGADGASCEACQKLR